jgi:membrane associated rhomboid family serine protease
MGIYNRDYYRDSQPPSGDWGISGLTPVVKYLLMANIAVFLLQIFVTREVRVTPMEAMRKYNPELYRVWQEAEHDPKFREELKKRYPDMEWDSPDPRLEALTTQREQVSLVQEWLELDTQKVVSQGQVWRLLTSAFCHDRMGVWHIFVNMLLLFWFGCTLESMYGSREFLLFYLTAAVVASLAFVALDLKTGSRVPAVGASGAVMGVVTLYTMHFPYESYRVFWLFPLEMRWILLIYVLFDLHPVLLALAGDRMFTGIGHAAHLGGLAFGLLYAHYQWRLDVFGERLALPTGRWRSRPKLRVVHAPHPELEPNDEERRVDQLLEKISESGKASLTEEESAFLRSASERMKERRNRGG